MRFPTDYVRAVRAAGGEAKVVSTFRPRPGEQLSPEVEVVADVDPEDVSVLDDSTAGLLLPGGGDIDPDLYGRDPHPRLRSVSRRRDLFELTLLKEALDRDMPVLAICRGFQLLNVGLGGTLDQHLADDPTLLDHDRDRVRAEYAHKVKIKERSPVAEILGAQSLGVNSHHHQGLDDIADGLEELAWAEDGVLEAVVFRERSWVIGVQWHPEVMTPMDRFEIKLFRAFLDAADAYGRGLEVKRAVS